MIDKLVIEVIFVNKLEKKINLTLLGQQLSLKFKRIKRCHVLLPRF